MKALLLKEPKQIVYGDYPTPRIGDDEALLQIKSVGICGTDLHIYHGGLKIKTPIMGHEFSGIVAKVGKHVHHIKKGDRVVGEHVLTCQQCYYCLKGQPTLCQAGLTIGLDRPGALAEYLAIPAKLLYKIPEHLSFEEAAMIEPLTIALYAIKQGKQMLNKHAAVIGQGPIGLMLDQVLHAAGASVIGIDIQPNRLTFAKKKGWVDAVVNSKRKDTLEVIKKFSGADGVDIAFEAVGRQVTAQLAINSARRDGDIYLLGIFEAAAALDLMPVITRELNIFGSWRCAFAFPEAIELAAKKKIDLKSLITHRYAAADGAQAFIDADSYAGNRIKTVINW